jgi:hypothetical protein
MLGSRLPCSSGSESSSAVSSGSPPASSTSSRSRCSAPRRRPAAAPPGQDPDRTCRRCATSTRQLIAGSSRRVRAAPGRRRVRQFGAEQRQDAGSPCRRRSRGARAISVESSTDSEARIRSSRSWPTSNSLGSSLKSAPISRSSSAAAEAWAVTWRVGAGELLRRSTSRMGCSAFVRWLSDPRTYARSMGPVHGGRRYGKGRTRGERCRSSLFECWKSRDRWMVTESTTSRGLTDIEPLRTMGIERNADGWRPDRPAAEPSRRWSRMFQETLIRAEAQYRMARRRGRGRTRRRFAAAGRPRRRARPPPTSTSSRGCPAGTPRRGRPSRSPRGGGIRPRRGRWTPDPRCRRAGTVRPRTRR